MRSTAAALFVLTALAAAQPAAAEDRIGRIYHYLRTNTDGSEPERVRVYRDSLTRLAVNKEVSLCTNAAYVTAELDLEAGEARRLTGGRLTREGTQAAFGTLTVHPDSQRIEAQFEPQPGQRFADSLDVRGRPRVVYDFDLSDLTVLLARRADHRVDFSFGLPLIWFTAPDDFLKDLGPAEATWEADVAWNGQAAHRFRVTAPGFGGKPGTLWVSAAEGHILAAEFPAPNHDNYRDFRLVLEKVEDAGAEGWRRLLMSHWEGCPPPKP